MILSPRVLMLSPDLFSPQARRRPPPPCKLHPSKVTTELVPPSLRSPASLLIAEGGNTYDEHSVASRHECCDHSGDQGGMVTAQ